MNSEKISGLMAIALLCIGLPAFAHHGTAGSYDQTKVVKIKGTVKEFRWRNPHSALFLVGKDVAGNEVTYSLEMGSPVTLVKYGLTRDSFKVGDEMVVEMHPSFTNPASGEAVSREYVINGKTLKVAGENAR
jgi:hypothetical protein